MMLFNKYHEKDIPVWTEIGNLTDSTFAKMFEDTEDEVWEQKWLGKINFVEIRSFWQIFRSFDRMWSFFILSLQAMIIMASHDLESPLQVFEAAILEDVMSIFITSAVLKLVQGVMQFCT
ncbi:unnamed protein product [Ilex paraguariensis]|uniref:Uncharacterized protein n=1 Tax=Ilex paraguariensis TaxID=185542 RepID=A0ABC8UAE8_9AQUA